jgi:hypothetical protein
MGAVKSTSAAEIQSRQGLGRAAAVLRRFGHPIWPIPGKIYVMQTVILFLAGLVCFYLFFKSIDYFENI